MASQRSLILTASAACAMLFPVAAHALTAPPPSTVPEPGSWALVGLAAVVGWLVSRNRRK